jgi:hypothetical protein
LSLQLRRCRMLALIYQSALGFIVQPEVRVGCCDVPAENWAT